MKHSYKPFLFAIALLLSICTSTNAQQFSWKKFSYAATFEPNMQVLQAFQKKGIFSDGFFDFYSIDLARLNFRTHLFKRAYQFRRDMVSSPNENHFTFLSGIRLYYPLNDKIRISSGALYLKEYYYINYHSSYTVHSDPFLYFVYEYFSDIVRFPLAVEFRGTKPRKVRLPVAIGLNFDFMLKDIVYYYNIRSDRGVERKYPFKFYRIVPEIMWGPEFKITDNFYFKFMFGHTYSSIYQRSFREFIPLNSSLSFKMILLYKPFQQ
ncbi:MAG: hypothetical protein PHP31_04850 [Lentimicrobiaceae bacterium]|nr:hypothetical protein [Lentimicrobiaceae bacterium]